MDKGIRPACNRKFVELLPQRATIGNTAFRKAVMASIMEDFGITLASAATHYNHAFITQKAADPASVEGLGRPEDKKGGRKPKVRAEAAAVEVPDAEAVVPTEFSVFKKSDSTLVAEKLSFEDAKALVASGRINGKFCKMYWV